MPELNILLARCCKHRDIRVLDTRREGSDITFRFVLRGSDGSLMTGTRTLPANTHFIDHADLADVLWQGELYDTPVEREAAPELNLLWVIPTLGVAFGATYFLSTFLTDVMHSSTILISMAICISSVMLGARHGLLAAVGGGVGFQFLLANSIFPTPEQYVRVIIWVALSSLLSYLCAHSDTIKAQLLQIEAKFSFRQKRQREI